LYLPGRLPVRPRPATSPRARATLARVPVGDGPLRFNYSTTPGLRGRTQSPSGYFTRRGPCDHAATVRSTCAMALGRPTVEPSVPDATPKAFPSCSCAVRKNQDRIKTLSIGASRAPSKNYAGGSAITCCFTGESYEDAAWPCHRSRRPRSPVMAKW
jgi:hypothetical protein